MNINKIDVSDFPKMKKLETSSKGNQNKWHIGEAYYKQDAVGYEGLSEVLSSRILEKSNADFVRYDFVRIEIMGEGYNGCVSQEMKQAGEILIPLERIVRNFRNINLAETLNRFETPDERIKYTVDLLNEIGVRDSGRELTKIIEADAFTLNQDRHTNNISILRGANGLRFSPIYDNGDSFFSDLMYFPMRFSADELLKRTTAKPFSGSFEKQKTAARQMYKKQLDIWFSKNDLIDFCHEAAAYYPEEYIERVREICEIQLEKYCAGEI